MSAIGNVVGSVVGGITGQTAAAEGAERAAQLQASSAEQGIAEQRRQFDAMTQLMLPYVGAGETALGQQQNLIGLGGEEAQRMAIENLATSPQMMAMQQQGEEAILQNAAATGGLRGGNTQAALAQFRPQILSDLISQQYGRLGGLTQMGQSAAAGQGAAGMQTASNIGNLYGQQGSALAGGQIAQGNVASKSFGDLMSIGGLALGASAAGLF